MRLFIAYPTLLRRTLLRPLALNRRFCWADSKVPRMALINRYRITRFNGFEIILTERFEIFAKDKNVWINKLGQVLLVKRIYASQIFK